MPELIHKKKEWNRKYHYIFLMNHKNHHRLLY